MHDSLHIVWRIFMHFHASSYIIESLAPGVGKACFHATAQCLNVLKVLKLYR